LTFYFHEHFSQSFLFEDKILAGGQFRTALRLVIQNITQNVSILSLHADGKEVSRGIKMDVETPVPKL